mgnify:CR=1 FL=1
MTDKNEAVDLRDRLRGKYAKGPRLANGEPEFGYSVFERMPDGKEFPAIHGEAADMIESLISELTRLQAEVEGLRKAAAPFVRAFETFDAGRWDDESPITIMLPTTKRVRPTALVHVDDVKRLRAATLQGQQS